MSNALKKRKVDDVNDKPPLLECHERLYYDDGNVIIIACSTLFRVHQSILTSNSSVIKALIATVGDIEIDGELGKATCPKIVLEDSKEDVERLLESLYDTRCVCSLVTAFPCADFALMRSYTDVSKRRRSPCPSFQHGFGWVRSTKSNISERTPSAG